MTITVPLTDNARKLIGRFVAVSGPPGSGLVENADCDNPCVVDVQLDSSPTPGEFYFQFSVQPEEQNANAHLSSYDNAYGTGSPVRDTYRQSLTFSTSSTVYEDTGFTIPILTVN